MSRPALQTALASLCVAFLALPAAGAITIDHFEVGGFSITNDPSVDGPNPTVSEESGFAPSDVLGGVRFSSVRTVASGPTFASLAPDAPAPGVNDGVFATTGLEGSLSLLYDGIANGIGDGQSGALNLDLSTFTSVQVNATGVVGGFGGAVPILMQLSLFDSSAAAADRLEMVLTNGVNTFLLGDFDTIDLTDIQTIRVSLNPMRFGATATLLSIIAVPEPGTGLLLAAGLVALGARRRSSRS